MLAWDVLASAGVEAVTIPPRSPARNLGSHTAPREVGAPIRPTESARRCDQRVLPGCV